MKWYIWINGVNVNLLSQVRKNYNIKKGPKENAKHSKSVIDLFRLVHLN